jgi:hypothetical protein
MYQIQPAAGQTAAQRLRCWWKRAGAAQADALLFVVYYTVVAPFALLARRGGAWSAPGWIARRTESGNSLENLRRQH